MTDRPGHRQRTSELISPRCCPAGNPIDRLHSGGSPLPDVLVTMKSSFSSAMDSARSHPCRPTQPYGPLPRGLRPTVHDKTRRCRFQFRTGLDRIAHFRPPMNSLREVRDVMLLFTANRAGWCFGDTDRDESASLMVTAARYAIFGSIRSPTEHLAPPSERWSFPRIEIREIVKVEQYSIEIVAGGHEVLETNVCCGFDAVLRRSISLRSTITRSASFCPSSKSFICSTRRASPSAIPTVSSASSRPMTSPLSGSTISMACWMSRPSSTPNAKKVHKPMGPEVDPLAKRMR